jgi:hypothetical protein
MEPKDTNGIGCRIVEHSRRQGPLTMKALRASNWWESVGVIPARVEQIRTLTLDWENQHQHQHMCFRMVASKAAASISSVEEFGPPLLSFVDL